MGSIMNGLGSWTSISDVYLKRLEILKSLDMKVASHAQQGRPEDFMSRKYSYTITSKSLVFTGDYTYEIVDRTNKEFCEVHEVTLYLEGQKHASLILTAHVDIEGLRYEIETYRHEQALYELFETHFNITLGDYFGVEKAVRIAYIQRTNGRMEFLTMNLSYMRQCYHGLSSTVELQDNKQFTIEDIKVSATYGTTEGRYRDERTACFYVELPDRYLVLAWECEWGYLQKMHNNKFQGFAFSFEKGVSAREIHTLSADIAFERVDFRKARPTSWMFPECWSTNF